MDPVKKYAHLLKKKWYIQSFNGTPAPIHMAGMSGIFSMKKSLGYSYSGFIADFKNDLCEFYYGRDDLHHMAHEFENRQITEPVYVQTLIDKSEKHHDEYIFFVEENLHKLDQFSDEELVNKYKEFSILYHQIVAESHVVEGYELTRDIKLKMLLLTELEKKGLKEKFNEYFTLLTSPIRIMFVNAYNNAILKIISTLKTEHMELSMENVKNNKKILALFQKLENDFYWINASYDHAKRMTTEDFIKEVQRILQEKKLPHADPEEVFEKNIREKNVFIEEIHLSQDIVKIIRILDIFAYWHDDRKKYLLQAGCALQDFCDELEKRTKIPAQSWKYILPEELTKENFITLTKEFFEERINGMFVIYDKDHVEVFSGEKYKKFRDALKKQEDEETIKEITGMCASPGKAVGKVNICQTLDDIKNFKEGEILVTTMTRPEFISAMSKSAAIVTNEGGITSHAAVIARELRKPCLIGTKCATKMLKNGMLVEVNANHGVVKVLE